MSGTAQQIIRRHAVIIAGAAHEAKARLSCAVFIMAQQGLADAQVRGGLPLADIASLSQGGKDLGKIAFHNVPH